MIIYSNLEYFWLSDTPYACFGEIFVVFKILFTGLLGSTQKSSVYLIKSSPI